jgi:NAD+ kinase
VAEVALVLHPLRPMAFDLAEHSIEWLETRGHRVRVPEEDARDRLAPWAVPTERLADGLDVELLSGSDAPVLGVNVGHLGYLNEVEPSGLEDALDRFFAGDFRVEERMTLKAEVKGTEAKASCSALNEVVLEKTVSGHTIRMAITINGEPFTTYAADGLIVATPTGSTAYNFSARGPIVSPRHRALLLTPVSPHMLFDRSLVLGPDEFLGLEVLDGRPATMVVDGRHVATLAEGDLVTCRAGPHDARFVSFGRRDFHQILKAKFGLADR